MFDGISFRNYHAGSLGLIDNYISCLYVEKSGLLWVGTTSAVTAIDLKTATSKTYNLNGVNSIPSVSAVLFITESPKEDIVVGTDAGVYSIKKSDNRPAIDSTLNVLTGLTGAITALKYHSEKTWIGTETGLFVKVGKHIQRIRESGQDTLPLRINDLLIDTKKNLWAATSRGLLLVDTLGRLSFIETGRFNSVIEDSRGIVWAGSGSGIASAGGKSGLYKIDNDRTIRRIAHDPNSPSSLSDDNIQVIYEDMSGGIWVGTFLQGLNNLENRRFNSGRYAFDGRRLGPPGSKVVRSIFALENKIFLGLIGGGIEILNTETRLTEGVPNTVYENPKVIFFDSKHRFLIGTDVGLMLVTRDFQSPKTLMQGVAIRCINEDRSGSIWVGTSSGLYNLDANLIPTNFKGLSSQFITSIYVDVDNEMWIGTLNDGLWRASLHNDRGQNLRTLAVRQPGPSSNRILSIEGDHEGTIWIGTFGNGLNRFEKLSAQFEYFTTENGLPNNVICAIKCDELGQTWVSTNRGISVYKSASRKFINFDQSDGLQSDEFNDGAVYQKYTGELYFGGVNGFNVFHPDSIKDNTHIPPVVLTSFKKFNREIDLSPPISSRRELTLSYEDYVVSFEFAALDFTNPEKNKYAYKLEGFDKDWTFTDAKRRFATYTNLDPGDYILRVKGSNNDGYWNEEGVSLKIFVTPPFWATWWFRTAIIGFIVTATVGGYRYRVQSIQNRNRWLESEVTKRTADLNRALDNLKETQVKLVHSEKMASLGTMVGGLSHEMNNSLGFVVSNLEFLKETMPKLVAMVETYDKWMSTHNQATLKQEITSLQEGIEMNLLKEDTNQAVRIAFEGTKRITRIIENLRRFALIQGGSWGEVEVESHLKFVAELFFGGDIDIKISIEADQGLKLHCMVGEFNVALMNILDNAVRAIRDAEKAGKLSKGAGQIELAGGRDSNKNILVRIADNGIGIPKDILPKIFDPFFTTRAVGYGKGMGLAEVYGVMKNHKGSAEAVSPGGSGTTVILTFPVS